MPGLTPALLLLARALPPKRPTTMPTKRPKPRPSPQGDAAPPHIPATLPSSAPADAVDEGWVEVSAADAVAASFVRSVVGAAAETLASSGGLGTAAECGDGGDREEVEEVKEDCGGGGGDGGGDGGGGAGEGAVGEGTGYATDEDDGSDDSDDSGMMDAGHATEFTRECWAVPAGAAGAAVPAGTADVGDAGGEGSEGEAAVFLVRNAETGEMIPLDQLQAREGRLSVSHLAPPPPPPGTPPAQRVLSPSLSTSMVSSSASILGAMFPRRRSSNASKGASPTSLSPPPSLPRLPRQPFLSTPHDEDHGSDLFPGATTTVATALGKKAAGVKVRTREGEREEEREAERDRERDERERERETAGREATLQCMLEYFSNWYKCFETEKETEK